MITIDYISLGIGFAIPCIILILYALFKPRKKKFDLHNLKKLVYDNGVKTKEVFDAFKELGDIFEEMEK